MHKGLLKWFRILQERADNKTMDLRARAGRRLLLPAIVVTGAALLILGARHPSAVASCDGQTSVSDGVQSGARPLSVPRDSSGSALCRAAPAASGLAAERSPLILPTNLQTNLQTNLAAALTAGLQRGGSGGLAATALNPLPGAPSLLGALSASNAIASSGLVWPVRGPITQSFGVPELGVGAPHTGIDIGQDVGSPVRATQSGRVVFAGGDPCCSLGYWIEVNHGNRYATRYGHLMRPPLALTGDYVTQGQIIGFSGTTGFSTGPHVHLELRRDGNPIDPLPMLPVR